jgi:hypothetical protein
MESPEVAREMACPMVLQACWLDLQLLLSLPFTPSTYQVLLASAVGAKAKNSRLNASLCFIVPFPLGEVWDTGLEFRLAKPQECS